jgi:hypothetical protein
LAKQYIYKDGLDGIAFDLDLNIPLDEFEILKQLEIPLVLFFDNLLKEPTDHRKSIQKMQDRLKFPEDSKQKRDDKGKGVLESEDTAAQQNDDQGVEQTWKLVKSAKEIHVYKRRLVEDDSITEISRGIFSILCDPMRVFGILSNPAHFRHVYENFLESSVLYESIVN